MTSLDVQPDRNRVDIVRAARKMPEFARDSRRLYDNFMSILRRRS